jgi:N-carbamoyl-L-amino-acid hydrolase
VLTKSQIRASGCVAIHRERLMDRHRHLSMIGATERGGVDRQAMTEADAQAHRLVMSWARARGWSVSADPAGNLFVSRPGADPALAPVATGSHLDSQPTGGRFDGAFGVLAGLEALEAIDDAGIVTRRPLQLVVWMNEEGCRFSPTTMGSGVFAGLLPLEPLREVTDAHGVRLGDALDAYFPSIDVLPGPVPPRPAAYVEAHIEQGPILEANREVIGVVSGVQGLRQFRLTLSGETAHAGTTPRALRRDAFAAMLRIATELNSVMADADDIVRFTIGQCTVAPGVPNTVAASATFTIDLRHPETAVLDRLEAAIEEICTRLALPCDATVERLIASPPVTFDPAITRAVHDAAMRRGHAARIMMSGAAHDAANLAHVCPSGMIFIPCRGGVSHREDEYAEDAHMVAATEVLCDVLLHLAGSDTDFPGKV